MRLRLTVVAAAVLVLGVLPFVVSRAQTARLAETGAYAIVLVGLTTLGRASRISLGQGAVMAVGGFTTALLVAREGVPALVTLPAAAAAGAAVGLLAAAPVVGRPGRYLAVPTLGLAAALPAILAGYRPVELPHPPAARVVYAVSWLLAVCLVAWVPSGLRLLDRAPPLAVDACSAACGGIGGGLVVLLLGRAAPAAFPLQLSLLLAAAACLAFYMPVAWAAVLGAAALEYVPDLVGHEGAGPAPVATVFGLGLVVLVLLSPLARRLRR